MVHPSKRTILLVEDETLVAHQEAETLARFGYEVVIAPSGRAAVDAALGNGAIDLILMDIDLGGEMDGTVAARKILDVRTLPIVFVTGHSQQEMVDKVRGMTRYGYVIKNSGDFVLQSSIEMAFELFEARQESVAQMEAIRKSEVRYRSLFQNMLNGFAYCKMHVENDRPVDFSFLAVNRAFEAQTGLRDVVGKSVSEVIPGIHQADPDLLERYGRVASTGLPDRFEIYVRTMKEWFAVSVHCPEIGFFVAVFDVITDRKKREEEILRLNERFTAATRAAGVGIWDMDPVHKRLIWDDQMYALYGMKRENAVDVFESWLNRVHPDDRARCKEENRQGLQGGKEYSTEFRVVWEDQSVHCIQAKANIFRNDAGDPLRVIGVNFDITERRRAEERLQRSEAQYHSLFDNIAEIYFVCEVINDKEGLAVDIRYVDANPACLQWMGYTKDGLVGHTYRELFPPNPTSAVWLEKFASVGRGGGPVRFEQYAEATGRYFEALAFHLQPDTCAVVMNDVTERRKAELQIEHSLREKETLLQELQHRVKNNLSTISSLLSLQISAVPDGRSRDILAETRGRIRTIALLYDQLHYADDYAGIQTKKYFENIVREFVQAYAKEGMGYHVVTEIADLAMDLRRAVPLGLILNEAVTNCVKHAFPGGAEGVVRITFRQEGERLTLEVTDNGRGLPASLDLDAAESMGFKLIKLLTGQIEGTLSVESDGGATVAVSFKL